MNSVMDDNRLLTLPSNERIRLLPHMKLIFEIRDLKYATPATATRAGILYISEGTQWNNMVQSWLTRVVRYKNDLLLERIAFIAWQSCRTSSAQDASHLHECSHYFWAFQDSVNFGQ